MPNTFTHKRLEEIRRMESDLVRSRLRMMDYKFDAMRENKFDVGRALDNFEWQFGQMLETFRILKTEVEKWIPKG